MRKLLDKERKKKKDPNKDGREPTAANGAQIKSTITAQDDIVITVKNTLVLFCYYLILYIHKKLIDKNVYLINLLMKNHNILYNTNFS